MKTSQLESQNRHRPRRHWFRISFLVILAGTWPSAISSATSTPPADDALPWRAAGLDARAAAAHLLDRFAYGPRPGDIDRVVDLGLERWLEAQLETVPDPVLDARLEGIPSLGMEPESIRQHYASFGRLRRMMKKAEATAEVEATELEATELDTAKVANAEVANAEVTRDPVIAERARLRVFARRAGLSTEHELMNELTSQKLLRAVYGQQQLLEVLTAFWLNHFCVSTRDSEVRSEVTSFERDAVRPRAFGKFLPLLEATARHPAMLVYLDNARSGASEWASRLFDLESFLDRWVRTEDGARIVASFRRQRTEEPAGANENYARELLELHTLGVDGYGEHDVRDVARAFTGWTVIPPARSGRVAARKVFTALSHRPHSGFVIDGEFLFRADRHDADAKHILGVNLAAGRGIDDGHDVLHLLAAHPATARRLARKLAIRFVRDDPPTALVDHLADVFLRTGGDTRALIRAIARSPDFWSPAARHSKVKTPFELAASALRATGAEIKDPQPVMRRVAMLGQPVYAASAPAGFPDTAEAWRNAGSTVARLRFGLDLGTGAIAGIDLDLDALTSDPRAARRKRLARRLTSQLLPGRDAPTLKDLMAVLKDPRVGAQLADEFRRETFGSRRQSSATLIARDDFEDLGPVPGPFFANPDPRLATLAGLILGSSAFQER